MCVQKYVVIEWTTISQKYKTRTEKQQTFHKNLNPILWIPSVAHQL